MATVQHNASRTWQSASSEIRDKYKTIGREELEAVAGNVEAVIELVHRKSGEAKQQVERYVHELLDEGSAGLARAGEKARDSYAEMAGKARAGYEQAGDFVQQRPAESVLMAFGVGALLGAVATMILSQRR